MAHICKNTSRAYSNNTYYVLLHGMSGLLLDGLGSLNKALVLQMSVDEDKDFFPEVFRPSPLCAHACRKNTFPHVGRHPENIFQNNLICFVFTDARKCYKASGFVSYDFTIVMYAILRQFDSRVVK